MKSLSFPSTCGVAAALVALATLAACGSDDSAPAAAGATGGGGGSTPVCQDTGQRPSPRAEMAGIVDPSRRRLVFFGGDAGFPKECNPAPQPIGELWTYDVACAAFTQVEGAGDPPPRARGVAGHDAVHDKMVLFGGRYREASSGPYTVYDDTWALDLTTLAWQKLEPTGPGPVGRSSSAAVVNPLTNELVVYGGNSSSNGASFEPLDDVWALDLATLAWRQIATTGTAPKARLFHATTVDPATGALFVYGGGGANAFQGPFYGDLWKLDLASGVWEKLDAGGAGAPQARIQATLAFDAERSRLLLFGGHDDGDVGNNNDTWAFDLGARTWTAITAPETVSHAPAGFCDFPTDFTQPNLAAPDRRSSQLGAFDASRGEWLVFGGKTDCGIINDVWSFDAATSTWTEAVPALIGEACLRGDFPDQCTSLCL